MLSLLRKRALKPLMPSTKRSASSLGASSSPSKKAKRTSSTSSPEANAVLGQDGSKWRDWPAPLEQIERARDFFRECAREQALSIIVPDKDADGLSSGMVVWKTLTTLGLPSDLIKVFFLGKGTSLFSPTEQERLETLINDSLESDSSKASASTSSSSTRPVRVIIVDQGSRPGPPLVRKSAVKTDDLKTIIIDHHMSTSWPDDSVVLTACNSAPIATSSLLTYLTCATLHPDIPRLTMWYAILGVFGDLSPSEINWGDPDSAWPASQEMIDLGEEVKRIGKKPLSSAVGAINAPRRTAEYNVEDAWKVLFKAKTPDEIARSEILQEARDKVNREVERCTHTAPKFSMDGRVALLRIDSGYQVHPVIATRWAGTLKSAKKLQMIMVENPGHNPNPDLTSFSCRLANQYRKLPEGERPNLIELLKEYGELTGDGFLNRVGEDFARGHKEATGGIIQKKDFELFMNKGMKIGYKDPNAPLSKKELKAKNEADEKARNTSLKSFFSVSPKKKKEEEKEKQEIGKKAKEEMKEAVLVD